MRPSGGWYGRWCGGVARTSRESGGDDPGNLGRGAVAVSTDQRVGGGGEFGLGGVLVEQSGADELA
jgi:hypothetical protein